jgi:membrane protein implicated in regulation of membrane protease activity
MFAAWFITFIVLLFIEIITVNLVTIWFAIGAVAAMITAHFTDSLLIQIIVFTIVSALVLLLTKPIVRKLRGTSLEATNSDRVIGKEAVVTKKITKNSYGEVKVLGNYWTACSDEKFDVDDKVIVKGIDGVKLIVEREEK